MKSICLLTLLLILNACSGQILGQAYSCIPDCSELGDCSKCPDPPCPDDINVVDPYNCHNYYVCYCDGTSFNTTTTSLPCPPGTHFGFEEGKGKCVDGDSCSTHCQFCTFDCSLNTGYAAFSNDCSSYLDCTDNSLLRCPDDKPYFNGKFCQKDSDKCCMCQPFCEEKDRHHLIADPKSCSNYYYCRDEGVPSEEDHFPCDPNTMFNPTSGKCEAEYECSVACQSGGVFQCVDHLTCPNQGYFPACKGGCDPRYFHCDDEGLEGDMRTCPNSNVFVPEYVRCMEPSACQS